MDRTGFRLQYHHPARFSESFPPPPYIKEMIIEFSFIQKYDDNGTITRIIKADKPSPFTPQEILERAQPFLPTSWHGQPIEVQTVFADSK